MLTLVSFSFKNFSSYDLYESPFYPTYSFIPRWFQPKKVSIVELITISEMTFGRFYLLVLSRNLGLEVGIQNGKSTKRLITIT